MSKELIERLNWLALKDSGEDDIFRTSLDRIEELERELHSVRADRDSWAGQADDRVKDAVGFIQERDALLADNARLREVLSWYVSFNGVVTSGEAEEAEAALAATPAQSLARIRNQVFEKVAGWINSTDLSKLPPEQASWLGNMLYSYAEAIRNMKEPE